MESQLQNRLREILDPQILDRQTPEPQILDPQNVVI